MITQERLKELLHYDCKIGIFIWKVSTNGRIRVGDIAGTFDSHRYIRIQVDRGLYRAHRLAWLYEYGYLPENEIDHVNKNKIDNRICNLREVTRQCNLRNRGNYKNNTSGVKGVYWIKKYGKWEARIPIFGKQFYIGYHDDYDEAVCHRLAAEQCIGWYGCDNNSPSLKYVKNNIQKNKGE